MRHSSWRVSEECAGLAKGHSWGGGGKHFASGELWHDRLINIDRFDIVKSHHVGFAKNAFRAEGVFFAHVKMWGSVLWPMAARASEMNIVNHNFILLYYYVFFTFCHLPTDEYVNFWWAELQNGKIFFVTTKNSIGDRLCYQFMPFCVDLNEMLLIYLLRSKPSSLS